MKTRNLIAAAQIGPAKSLLPEVAALQGLQRKEGWPRPVCYYFNSYLRPLEGRCGLFLFIKTASALQSLSGGHCPARMAARMLAIHRFEGATLHALQIAGILLIVAGLLSLAVGGFSFRKKTHQARPGPLECLIKEQAAHNFPAWATAAGVAVGGALLPWRQQGHAPHFVSSLPPRGPPHQLQSYNSLPLVRSL